MHIERSNHLVMLISNLENNYASSHTPNVNYTFLTAKNEFDLKTSKQAAEHLFCKFGEKPNELLGHQLCQSALAQLITQLIVQQLTLL